MAAKVEATKVQVEKTHDKMDALLRSVEKMQACIDVNTRAVERMEERIQVLEAKPSLAACKSDIMTSVANAINSNALADLKQDVGSLRATLLTLAVAPGGSVAGDSPLKGLMSQPGFSALMTPSSAAKPDGGVADAASERGSVSTGAGGADSSSQTTLPKAPAGLPNARIFRKLQASGASSASSSPAAAGALAAAPDSVAPVSGASTSSSSYPGGTATSSHGMPGALAGSALPTALSAVSPAPTSQATLPLSGPSVSGGGAKADVPACREPASGRAPEVVSGGNGALDAAGVGGSSAAAGVPGQGGRCPDSIKLPTALEEHLKANGVQVQDPQNGWISGSEGPGMVVAAPGVGGGDGEGADGQQQASSQGSPVASQQQLGDGGQGGGHPPYSASFKEVMAIVQAGKTPPDVVKVDDSPLAAPSLATAGPPPDDAPKPRAKPWERNFSGSKPLTTPHAPAGSVGGDDASRVPAAVAALQDHAGLLPASHHDAFPPASPGAPSTAMAASATRVNSNLDVPADEGGPLAEGAAIRALPVCASPFEPGAGGKGVQLADFAAAGAAVPGFNIAQEPA
jgi:hypothetical protein